jgi:hypothetical protein
MCCAAQEKVSFCDDVSDFEISHHEIAQIFAKINDDVVIITKVLRKV